MHNVRLVLSLAKRPSKGHYRGPYMQNAVHIGGWLFSRLAGHRRRQRLTSRGCTELGKERVQQESSGTYRYQEDAAAQKVTFIMFGLILCCRLWAGMTKRMLQKQCSMTMEDLCLLTQTRCCIFWMMLP